MTKKEQQLLGIIQKNPSILQSELAVLLGISQASTETHILNLTKKCNIKDYGDISKMNPPVTVIGGANMDIVGFSEQALILNDSNPGKLRFSAGGVARNIAENLIYLDIPVRLITAVGQDEFGRQIMMQCNKLGIDCRGVYQSSNIQTATYLAIIDHNGELVLALSQMDGIEQLALEHISKQMDTLRKSEVVVLDTNLTEEVIFAISTQAQTNIFVDGVSTAKVKRLQTSLPYIHTLKLNALEAKELCGIDIIDERTAQQVRNYFCQLGVQAVAITLGEKGAYFMTRSSLYYEPAKHVTPVNATGAGDAFMAGLVYCHLYNKSAQFTLQFAQAAAKLALLSEKTVTPNLKYQSVLDEI